MKEDAIWILLIAGLVGLALLNTPDITGGAIDENILKFYGKQGINPYDTFMIDWKTITLEEIFSDESVSVSVNDVLVLIRPFSYADINCLRIVHNGVFINKNNPLLSKALLDVKEIC